MYTCHWFYSSVVVFWWNAFVCSPIDFSYTHYLSTYSLFPFHLYITLFCFWQCCYEYSCTCLPMYKSKNFSELHGMSLGMVYFSNGITRILWILTSLESYGVLLDYPGWFPKWFYLIYNVSFYMYTHTHTHVCMCLCIHTHLYMHVHIYVCIYLWLQLA